MALKSRSAAKQLSDALYNSRRRAKRQADALERKIAAGKIKPTRQVRAYISDLREQARATYIGGKREGKAERLASAQKVSRQIDMRTKGNRLKSADQRLNTIWSRAISLSGSDGTGLGNMSKEQAKIFWQATKPAWKGKKGNRYELIIEHYGANLQDIWKKVMRENKEAVYYSWKMKQGGSFALDTDDPFSLLQMALGEGVDSELGSPPYLAYVDPISR